MASTNHISKHSASSYGSLVDRGANGGLAGADVSVLERTGRKVSVTGIDDHELPGLDIVTCVALIQTNHGRVNMLMHEYAYYGRGNTIHSACQIEWFQNTCDDKSHHVGGKQAITFLDGYDRKGIHPYHPKTCPEIYIQKSFENTTQWATTPTRFPMRKHFKSRFPAFNIPRRNEAVATDTIFSDTPAIDSGVTMAKFVGKDTLVSDVYGMQSSKQFVHTLEDKIRFRGAMSKLISDYAQVEISNKVKDILRMYHSSSWHSEPYHQNQNPAEWCYRTIKAWTNTILNRTGAPAHCWLLCMSYTCYILNHLSCKSLEGQIPLTKLYGITPDISIIMMYTFYQPVYYASHNQSFSSTSEVNMPSGLVLVNM